MPVGPTASTLVSSSTGRRLTRTCPCYSSPSTTEVSMVGDVIFLIVHTPLKFAFQASFSMQIPMTVNRTSYMNNDVMSQEREVTMVLRNVFCIVICCA